MCSSADQNMCYLTLVFSEVYILVQARHELISRGGSGGWGGLLSDAFFVLR